MENLTGGTPPVRYLPCVVPCKLYFVGIIITIAVAVVGTLICVAIVRVFTPLRVSVREEQVGLDISEHGESAYPSFNGLDQ